ncbi:hypothetical protein DFH09DRAFT_1090229 [Mycena vulgaris]|nr:hypothetical protein DFH09DRAFT_1090229 [Mycena vulgaris]
MGTKRGPELAGGFQLKSRHKRPVILILELLCLTAHLTVILPMAMLHSELQYLLLAPATLFKRGARRVARRAAVQLGRPISVHVGIHTTELDELRHGIAGVELREPGGEVSVWVTVYRWRGRTEWVQSRRFERRDVACEEIIQQGGWTLFPPGPPPLA